MPEPANPPSRLEEIAARLGKITPGPWSVSSRDVDGYDGDFLGHEIEGPPDAYRGQFARRADAEFIAHSPEEVAYLLSVAEASAALLAALKNGESDRRIGLTVATWFNDDPESVVRGAVDGTLHDALTMLADALGWTPKP